MQAPSRRSYAVEAAVRAWVRVLPAAVIQLADFLAATLVLRHFFRTEDDLRGYIGLGFVGFAMITIQYCVWSKVSSLLESRVVGIEAALCWEEIRETVGFAFLAPFHLHTMWAGQLSVAAQAELAAMSADLAFSRKKQAWNETAARQLEALDRYKVVLEQTKVEKSQIADERWYLLYEKIEYRVKKHILEQRIPHLQRTHSFHRTTEILQDRVDHVKARLADMKLHEAANVQGRLARLKEKHDGEKWKVQQVTIERRKAIQEAKLNHIAVTSPACLQLLSKVGRMSGVLTWIKFLQGSLQSLPLAVLTVSKISFESDDMDSKDFNLLFSSLILFSVSMTYGFFAALVSAKATVLSSSATATKCHPLYVAAIAATVVWALFAMGMCYGTPSLGALSYLLPAFYLLHGLVFAGFFVALKQIHRSKTKASNKSTQGSFNTLKSLPDARSLPKTSADRSLPETSADGNFLRSVLLCGLCTALASAVTDILSLVSKEQRALYDAHGLMELAAQCLPAVRRILLLGMAVAGLEASYSHWRIAWIVVLCCLDLVAGAFLRFPKMFTFLGWLDEVPEDHVEGASDADNGSAGGPQEDEASRVHEGVEISAAPVDSRDRPEDYVRAHPGEHISPGGTGLILEVAAEGLNEIMKTSGRHHWKLGTHHHHHNHSTQFLLAKGRGGAKKQKPKKTNRQATPTTRYVAKNYSQMLERAGPSSSVALPQAPARGSLQAKPTLSQQLLSLCSPDYNPEEELEVAVHVSALEPVVRPERSASSSVRDVRKYVAAQRLLRVGSDCVEAVLQHANAALARTRGSSIPKQMSASPREEAVLAAPALVDALVELQKKAAGLAGVEIAPKDVITIKRGVNDYTPSTSINVVGGDEVEEGGRAERKLLDALGGKREEGSDARAAARKQKVACSSTPRATTLQYALSPQHMAQLVAWASVPTVFGPTPLQCAASLRSSGAASSFEAAKCECFVSHSWSDSRSQRKHRCTPLCSAASVRTWQAMPGTDDADDASRAILELFVLRPLLSTSLALFPLLAALLFALAHALAAELGFDAAWVLPVIPIWALACILLWLFGSCACWLPGRLSPWAMSTCSMWLDSMSVDHETDSSGQRIAGFKTALHKSDRVLAMVSATYFRRLWCVYELAMAAKTKPRDLVIVSLEWRSSFSPWLSAQLTDAERSWFADFTCRGAEVFAPRDRIAVLEAIRDAFGTEEAFDLFVQTELPAFLRRSKRRHARALRASFRDALSSVLGA